MTDNQEKVFKKELEKELKKSYTQGLAGGAKAVSSIILDKAKVYNGTNADEVIAEIIRFCEVGLGKKGK